MLPDEPLLLEKLLKRARDTGNERLLAYIFRNAAHLRKKVQICRALETCDEKLEDAQRSPWKRFMSALDMPCLCSERQWVHAARALLAQNSISESELTGKIKAALLSGLRRKQDAVCFAGREVLVASPFDLHLPTCLLAHLLSLLKVWCQCYFYSCP